MSEKARDPFTITVSRTGRKHGLEGFGSIERPFMSTEVRFDGTESAAEIRDKVKRTVAFLDSMADDIVVEQLAAIREETDRLVAELKKKVGG